jgi:hypothetical protein
VVAFLHGATARAEAKSPPPCAPLTPYAGSLKNLSTGARFELVHSDGTLYKTYQQFYDYYLDYDYADKWVSAALSGENMDFTSGKHSPNNFAVLGAAARIEAVKKGTAYMHVWMYAIGEFENAIDDCETCTAGVTASPPPATPCNASCTDLVGPFATPAVPTCAAASVTIPAFKDLCDGGRDKNWPGSVICAQTCADVGHNYADPPCCTAQPPSAPPPAPTICNEHAASTVSVHAWDEGVAFYTGSLEGAAYGGSTAGKLLYRLAEKRCANFGTCSTEHPTSGTSQVNTGSSSRSSPNPNPGHSTFTPSLSLTLTLTQVNTELFELFATGRDLLQQGRCSSVRPLVNQIVSLMTVPLVQGSLRYAYFNSGAAQGASPKNAAEGATFSAAVLPLVHNCSQTAAATISDNLKFGLFPDGSVANTTRYSNFSAVKSAFEDVYACLGIECAQVGGLLNGTAPYPGAKACPV